MRKSLKTNINTNIEQNKAKAVIVPGEKKNLKNIVTDTTADARKGKAYEAPINKFPMQKIRFADD